MEDLIVLLIPLTIIAIGYIAGTINEKNHYKSIVQREQLSLHLPAVTIKNATDPNKQIAKAELVYGNAVISTDRFKQLLAGLINIFGGEVSAYETLVDRARRESILRMKAMAHGANIILNMRIETSSISKSANRKKSIGSVEALVYGTAVTYQ
ncbi:YbjQ family protein [Candidatus Margulisiibacteriota bacterium]